MFQARRQEAFQLITAFVHPWGVRVYLTFVTWIACFMSQWSLKLFILLCLADLCDMDSAFRVAKVF